MSALIQQSEEWLTFRRNKIGSSDAPIIMERSPWRTPYQLWLEKLSPTMQHTTNAMKRGLDLEEAARDKFEQMTGLTVFPQVVQHPTIEFMIASLDGMTIEGNAIVEIKCPGREDQVNALRGKIPEKYYPQLQHQMEVCELDKAYYFSYDGEDGVILEISRDDKYIKRMIQKEEEFWNCLQDFTPPQMTDKDFQYKSDDIWKAAAQEWVSVHKQLKACETRERELRDLLISMSQKQNSCGGGVKVSRFFRKGNIDYSQIPELLDLNLEQYRKDPTEYWKIGVSL